MMRAAVDGAREGSPECRVLAVTVLTSLDAAAVGAAWGRGMLELESEVLRLADTAAECGTYGIVCSGAELGAVRARFGERLACLVPGIRFSGGATYDQSRVVTPAAAAALGARYVVLGRAVTGATEPREAMRRANRELGRGSDER
jgi:orotidine-5'-phosphate decarboxylase